MRILILGGTQFVGRAVAEAALAAGDEVTLFHRGRTNPGILPAAEHVLGDRDGGLAALDGRTWDAVVDTSGYVPRVVGQSAAALAGRAARYLFVSSISVYAQPRPSGYRESAALVAATGPGVEEITGATYGGLKVACEQVVREAWGAAATIVRPGIVVGPGDYTDRFGYWPRRIAAGGEVLAPGPEDAPVQVLDVRDLGGWLRALLDRREPGPLHAAGPAAPLTFGGLLDACREAAAVDTRITWVDPDWLLARQVAPWSDLPLWIPAASIALHQADCSAARAAGLTLRPIAATVAETLAWERAHPPAQRPPRTGLAATSPLAAERETELLRAWTARS